MEKQPITATRSQKSSSCKKQTPAVKVVYISNPMKINASPSEFRAVVQQLTGRYATSPPYSHQQVIVTNKLHNQEQEEEEEEEQLVRPPPTRSDILSYDQSAACREDEVLVGDHFVITPQMLEGFTPLLPPSI